MNTRLSHSLSCRRAAVLLLAAVASVTPGVVQAQQGPLQPVKWSLALEPAPGQVAAGGTLTAVVTASIGEGWHVYAPDEANVGPRPVEITVVKSAVFSAAGKVDAPEPEREMDQAFGQITASYTEKATFRLPVAVAADAPAGPCTLEIDVAFQACDGNICLPAKAARVKAAINVTK
jgi:DsbC/DsbD-like thiol-disulfide interchange protein